jgi:hypothetical protein
MPFFLETTTPMPNRAQEQPREPSRFIAACNLTVPSGPNPKGPYTSLCLGSPAEVKNSAA